MDGEWQRTEPGHPTKTPGQMRMEEVFSSANVIALPAAYRLTKALTDEGVLAEGGGI